MNGLPSVDDISRDLPGVLGRFREGSTRAFSVGDKVPEAVVLSTSQYRILRGDDEPPAGVVDDPTKHTYNTEPLPDSRPFSLDEIAALMGPEAVQDLKDLRGTV